jgi:hypothetical protein
MVWHHPYTPGSVGMVAYHGLKFFVLAFVAFVGFPTRDRIGQQPPKAQPFRV